MFKDAGAGPAVTRPEPQSKGGARAVPQRAASEQTRQQILDTALALFREHGFEETTIRDVASAAGLSLGAAYYYFKSKEAIVAAYYDYVQREHAERARAAFARGGDLRSRLGAVLHTKIDIMQEDRRLLRALFRYGGDPDHALSWFGPATEEQRRLSISIFAEALAGERLPADVRDAAPTLLWTLHMGVLLYFLYDGSPRQARTRRLIDAAVDFTVDVRRLATSPLLRPIRKRVFGILRDAGLIDSSMVPSRA
jgi:AcrR family transcriptional regulator